MPALRRESRRHGRKSSRRAKKTKNAYPEPLVSVGTSGFDCVPAYLKRASRATPVARRVARGMPIQAKNEASGALSSR